MSKQDMLSLHIRSPNMADSVMMALDNPELAEAIDFSEGFKSLW
jgi:hypothetical protein